MVEDTHSKSTIQSKRFENKARDFVVLLIFFSCSLHFLSNRHKTNTREKKKLKTRKNTSSDLFLLSLVDLHASRPVQFAQYSIYSNAFWTLCRYRYRYWYSVCSCVCVLVCVPLTGSSVLQLRQCFCFRIIMCEIF